MLEPTDFQPTLGSHVVTERHVAAVKEVKLSKGQNIIARTILEPQKHVKYWPKTHTNNATGNCFTYFWAPGKDTQKGSVQKVKCQGTGWFKSCFCMGGCPPTPLPPDLYTPSTQYSRTLVPKTIMSMVFGTRVLKYWVLGPSRPSRSQNVGWDINDQDHSHSPRRHKERQ